MSQDLKKQSSGFLTGSDENQPVQPQKIARSLKSWIKEEEMYCPCSKNKGADQLCSYMEFLE